MPRTLRHSLRRRRRYLGELSAQGLVEWLERNRTRKAGRRVSDLLREMCRVVQMPDMEWIEHGKMSWGEPALIRSAKTPEAATEMVRLYGKINRALARYRLYAQVSQSIRGWESGENPDAWAVLWLAPGESLERSGSGVKSESAAVGRVLELSRLGVVHSVRECLECDKWFFARFRHQRFCLKRCQLRHYQTSPGWRQHRRDYMTKYRRRNPIGRTHRARAD